MSRVQSRNEPASPIPRLALLRVRRGGHAMRASSAMRALAGLLVLAWAAGTHASRIVALPLCGAPSHVFIMWKVCKELVERGHDIKVRRKAGRLYTKSWCTRHASQQRADILMLVSVMQLVAAASDAGAFEKWDWSGMSIVTYREAFNQSEWRQQARNARFKDPVQGGLEGIRMWGQQCDILLSDSNIIAPAEGKPSEPPIPTLLVPVLNRCCSTGPKFSHPTAQSGARNNSGEPGHERNVLCCRTLMQTCSLGIGATSAHQRCPEVLQVPRVTVSNIPIVDPLHTTWDRSTGRRMHVPNMLAYTPQVSTD